MEPESAAEFAECRTSTLHYPNRQQIATVHTSWVQSVLLCSCVAAQDPVIHNRTDMAFAFKSADVVHKFTLWLFTLTSPCYQISCSQTASLSKLNLCLRSLVIPPDLPSTSDLRYAATSTRITVFGWLEQKTNRTCIITVKGAQSTWTPNPCQAYPSALWLKECELHVEAGLTKETLLSVRNMRRCQIDFKVKCIVHGCRFEHTKSTVVYQLPTLHTVEHYELKRLLLLAALAMMVRCKSFFKHNLKQPTVCLQRLQLLCLCYGLCWWLFGSQRNCETV